MSSNPIDVAASKWLARFDVGECTPAEQEEFDRWFAADPRHAAAYLRLSAVWQRLDRVQAMRPAADGAIHDDFFAEQSHPLAAQDPPGVEVSSPRATRTAKPMEARGKLFAVAASVLLAAAIGWFFTLQWDSAVYTTSKGGFQRLVLQDQSAIELNTDSAVRVDFTGEVRSVELMRGEASFEVAHDPTRPFVVKAGDTAVRAVGTRFNVRRFDGSIEVLVSEGKVLVGAAELFAQSITAVPPSLPVITAGHAVVASAEKLKVEPLPADAAARKLAWQERMLVFDGEPLANVVAEFNRYNQQQLVVSDPELAALKIGGYFRPTNLDTFISVLESSFGVRAASEAGRVTLMAADAERTGQ